MSGVAAEQLAGLPGMPASVWRVHARAAAEGWQYAEQPARGRNGTRRLYTIASLPSETRQALAAQAANTIEATAQTNLTASQREAVTARLPFVEAIAEQLAKGTRSVDMACAAVAASCPHSARTLRRWWDRVRKAPREEWAARLTPGWRAGKHDPAACHPEFWAVLRSDYLREQQPAFEACYRRAVARARAEGWEPIATLTAMRRRLEREVSPDVLLLARKGRSAFELSIPSQRRMRPTAVMMIVNADGHRADVMVRWPDGTYARPFLVGFEDLHSNKILSWRVDKSENIEPCRLAFADMVTEYGIPWKLRIDNGRAWCADALSAGVKHRYRRRGIVPETTEEQAKGLFKACGCDPQFTKPRNGRAKHIERTWRDFCEEISKHPLLAKAYLGNRPENRPESWYKENAVDLDVFLEVCAAGITELNAREGRRAHDGRSNDAVFAESYTTTPIRQLTEDQRRMLWLRSQLLVVRQDTTVQLFGAVYTGPCLRRHRGKRIWLRIDPDNINAGAYAYTAGGDFLGFLRTIAKSAQNDVHAAQESRRAHQQLVRATNRELKALAPHDPADLGRKHIDIGGKPAEQLRAKVTAIMPGVARAQTAPRQTPEPTADEIEAAEQHHAAIIDIGRRARPDLDERTDDVVLEIGRASFAALADQRR